MIPPIPSSFDAFKLTFWGAVNASICSTVRWPMMKSISACVKHEPCWPTARRIASRPCETRVPSVMPSNVLCTRFAELSTMSCRHRVAVRREFIVQIENEAGRTSRLLQLAKGPVTTLPLASVVPPKRSVKMIESAGRGRAPERRKKDKSETVKSSLVSFTLS